MSPRLRSDPALASQLAGEIGTPFYLISEQRLLDNMLHLRGAVRASYPNTEVTYSVKSNNLAAFVTACIEGGLPVEVVSRAEYDYVEHLGADLTTTTYNGPAKRAEDIRHAVANGSFVNADSLDELRLMAELGIEAPVGVRVPATLASGAVSRFGIDLSDPTTLAETRELVSQLNVRGLHIHHSSERDAESYGRRLEHLLAVADQLNMTDVEVLDLGGGFSSPLPDELKPLIPYETASFDQYGEVLGARASRLLGNDGPKLVLEPGIGVLANCATYVTSVQSMKCNGGQRFAVVDGSIFEVNPLRSSIGPPMVHLAEPSDAGPPAAEGTKGDGARVVGATCMEIDVFGDLATTPKLGDLISVENVGSYTTSLGPDFIVPRSPVVSIDSNNIVRHRSTLNAVGIGPAEPEGTTS